MRSLLNPHLSSWLEDGLNTGRFDVPGGRHIILNEFPRLMRQTRFLASARVDAESFSEFIVSINPRVLEISDRLPNGLRDYLTSETDTLPGLRRAIVEIPPLHKIETWYVFTPPLETMRRAWKAICNVHPLAIHTPARQVVATKINASTTLTHLAQDRIPRGTEALRATEN